MKMLDDHSLELDTPNFPYSLKIGCEGAEMISLTGKCALNKVVLVKLKQ